jgi:TRAP-type C4-dicarboxylate transport system permease small subunit
MEAIFDRFPPTMQKVVTVITNLIAAFCFAYIIPYGINFTISQHSIASPAMGMPMSYVFVAVPLGSAVLVLRLLIDTIKVFRPAKNEEGGR